MFEHLPELITTKQLHDAFGIPRTTALKWHKTNDFPAPIMYGDRAVRYRKSEVIAWLDAQPRANTFNGEAMA